MAARRGRGSTAVDVIFSQHAEILQYSRKTITGRFRATDRLDILYKTVHVWLDCCVQQCAGVRTCERSVARAAAGRIAAPRSLGASAALSVASGH